jgi:hypothetical protein
MGDIQQDPSMEEILASIKRVIREDGRPAPQARAPRRNGRAETPPPAPAPAPAMADEDVLELDDPMDAADDGLISDNVAAASRQSLAALSAMRAAPPTPPADGGALETAVRDMLRPMLKEWLEEHLPQIVEELVTREITRITGRNL